MGSFDLENLKTINTIIERDSKDTTYKFALLRGVIEISQEYQHLVKESGDSVSLPLGLLIEKWLLYYYPVIESQAFLPQLHGEKPDSFHKRISFRPLFREVTDYYAGKGGFSAFYNDYVNGSLAPEISPAVYALIAKIRTTITTMPMKHLGRSQGHRDYSVFCTTGMPAGFPPGCLLARNRLCNIPGHFLSGRTFSWYSSTWAVSSPVMIRWYTNGLSLRVRQAGAPLLLLRLWKHCGLCRKPKGR